MIALVSHLLRFKQERREFEGLLARALLLRGAEPATFSALVERIVIGLQDSWSTACRSIVLDSASGRAMTRKGRTLPRSTLVAGKRPIDFLRAKWASATGKSMGRHWEPDWFIPANAVRAATLLGLANEIELTNGFGASPILEHLRTTRNLIVHSLPNTWERYRALQKKFGIKPMLRPADFVVSPEPAFAMRRLELWLSDLETSLVIAIE